VRNSSGGGSGGGGGGGGGVAKNGRKAKDQPANVLGEKIALKV
jgi:hypothetical protein